MLLVNLVIIQCNQIISTSACPTRPRSATGHHGGNHLIPTGLSKGALPPLCCDATSLELKSCGMGGGVVDG